MAQDRPRASEDDGAIFDADEPRGRANDEDVDIGDATPVDDGDVDVDEEVEEENAALDEDVSDAEEALTHDRAFTTEVGSEGGSQGDMEVEEPRPRVLGGSEATTTGTSRQNPGFDDRHAGGGVPPGRRGND